RKHESAMPLIYMPALILLAIQIAAVRFLQPSGRLLLTLDRLQMGYASFFFVAAAGMVWFSYRRPRSAGLRQPLKWVTRGTILAITPYTMFYVLPFLTGALPTVGMRISVLSLALLPLTFGYAIFRYRLMDVDLIFKRGMVYTVSAAAIVGFYFAIVA